MLFVVFFWRLGQPSFWDPDEPHYAQTSSEMLASGEFRVPVYDGKPFFDKPVLFHALQATAMWVLGPTELAARLFTALAALALVGVTRWLGAALFDAETGDLAALMLATTPGMFAFARCAILDMVFTAFLVSGIGLIAVSAFRGRPRLQYAGYALLALAVLTKGPLALALTGLTFGVTIALSGEARRRILELHWLAGLGAVILLSAPWFLWMWSRFGDAFVEGYVLRENLLLFSEPLYGDQPSSFFYPRVVAAGLLPWTPLVAGYAIDRLRAAFRGRVDDAAEVAVWAWAIAVPGFFTLSSFKLDHYVLPAGPAFCLLAARGWRGLAGATTLRPWAATSLAAASVGVLLAGGGVFLTAFGSALPLDLPAWALLGPLAMVAAGAASTLDILRSRGKPRRRPLSVVFGLACVYATLLAFVLPALESAKAVRDVGRWVAAHAKPEDRVASYLNDTFGMSASWRFYLGRTPQVLTGWGEIGRFLAAPGRAYCAMEREHYDFLRAAGLPIRIAHERDALLTTTHLRFGSVETLRWRRFVVATNTAP